MAKKASELRNISLEELDVLVDSLRKEIYELRSARLDSKTQKTHMISEKKKEVARVLTVKREKELQVRA
ncbi:MAG: 50S ribosomal protein L29 [Verrucomicrobia bacterium]|nr:50S ribosomal protein L29 [Verrucomicrobiota bacterium]MBS0647155.1 50S ribosomal protein L29 [Verrucomicrobiota bacterium]